MWDKIQDTLNWLLVLFAVAFVLAGMIAAYLATEAAKALTWAWVLGLV